MGRHLATPVAVIISDCSKCMNYSYCRNSKVVINIPQHPMSSSLPQNSFVAQQEGSATWSISARPHSEKSRSILKTFSKNYCVNTSSVNAANAVGVATPERSPAEPLVRICTKVKINCCSDTQLSRFPLTNPLLCELLYLPCCY